MRRNDWLDIVAAVIGGLMLGNGFVRLVTGFTIMAAVWTALGIVLLWWALSDRSWRRDRAETPVARHDDNRPGGSSVQ